MAHHIRKECRLTFCDHQLIAEWRGEACFTASLEGAASSSSRRCKGGLHSVPAADQELELQTVEMQLGISNVTM